MRVSSVLAFITALGALAASGPRPAQAADPPEGGSAAAATEAGVETPSYPTLDLIGFTDAGFSATDADSSTSNSGFFQGQFVLHFTSALSSRIAFFGEVSVATGDSAAYGAMSHGGANADLHRSILKYSHSDALKLSIGRFHTPISYWNTAFHHGQWLQTTVTRPKALDFSNPFLPLHFIGAFAEGQLPSGKANLGYLIGVGNGRNGGPGRPDAPGDADNHRAWLVRLSTKPEWPSGLHVGGAFQDDKVAAFYGQTRVDFRERIWNAYLAFTRENPEIIAEYIALDHDRIGRDESFRSWSYYAQAAWRVTPRIKPYVRWEEIHLDPNDHLVQSAALYHGGLVGVRLDPSELVALKVEYHRQEKGAAPFRNGVFSQVCLTF
jgi:hypothetical protein